MQLSKESKIPLGLKRIVRDSFKCKICHAVPINPPVIMSKCCKTLIGCEPCINTLYSGPDALTKPCPCCRSERGYNETMVLRGIDEFLQSFKRVVTIGVFMPVTQPGHQLLININNLTIE